MNNEDNKSKFFDPMTHLFVKDVIVSKQFYAENFGFVETFRDKKEGIPDHVELKLGNFQLAVSSISAAQNIHDIKVGTGLPTGALVFWTENCDEVYNQLIAKGVSSIKTPHDFRGTLRPAWIADPDGNYIQIVSRKK